MMVTKYYKNPEAGTVFRIVGVEPGARDTPPLPLDIGVAINAAA